MSPVVVEMGWCYIELLKMASRISIMMEFARGNLLVENIIDLVMISDILYFVEKYSNQELRGVVIGFFHL